MDGLLKHFIKTANQIKASFLPIKDAVVDLLPHVLTAGFILVIGWFVAKIAHYIGVKLCELLFKIIPTFEDGGFLQRAYSRRAIAKAFGIIFYWVVFIYFIFLAIKVLGLPELTAQITSLLKFMPMVISAIAIIFIGFIVGSIARDALAATLKKHAGKEVHFVPEALRFGIITIFAIWSMGIIGLNISILIAFFSIILAALLGSVALGFGLGSVAHVTNLIAANQLRKHFQIGETIKIDEHEGTIVEITRTTLILESKKGKIIIPAKLTNELMSVKKE